MNRFRAKLSLDEQRLFLDMWQKAAGESGMPTRQRLSPCQFSSFLPFISLFEFNDSQTGIRLSVVGSGLKQIFGEDPKIALLDSEFDGGINAVNFVRESCKPICGVSQNLNSGRTGLVRFWMRLPLGTSDEIDGVIGLDLTLSSTRAPIWALEQIKNSLAS